MATLLKVDGSSVEVEPGGELTIEWLRGLVEGYVELVRCDDGSAFACDEDGGPRGLALNVPATMLAAAKRVRGIGSQGLRGPVVFLSAADVRRLA